ncbi:MAG: halocarboxylic acid dehydrogenase DehI family protein [Burkholderiales bacterium]
MLPRHKPNPIPAIHPLPEYKATGARKAVYEDTKAVLGVPWMGVVTMAFSHYPSFYQTLWSGVRPLCQSRAFGDACLRLRAFTEAQAADFPLADLQPALRSQGYAERELDDIRAIIEVFSVGNMPYLLLATLARLLLQGNEMGGPVSPGAAQVMAGMTPVVERRLILLERHHADAPTRAVYDDIQATLGLPLINTDYRALARWPSYFAAAWGNLKPVILGNDYPQRAEAIHYEAVRLALALPNPGGLRSAALQSAALADAPKGEVDSVVGLFQWLLPGLVANVAGFQRQIKPS